MAEMKAGFYCHSLAGFHMSDDEYKPESSMSDAEAPSIDRGLFEAQRRIMQSEEYRAATPKERAKKLKYVIDEYSQKKEITGFLSCKELPAYISGLLAEDAALRKPGNHGSVYGIDDLAPFSRLGHGVPIVRNWNAPHLDAGICRVRTDDEYRGRLHSHAPFLEHFDLRKNGMLLAGGAAAGVLMRQEKLYHDFDFFMVGHSNYSALEAIRRFADHLFYWQDQQWRASESDEKPKPMMVYRTKGCLTFLLPLPETPLIQAQVILRHYKYPREVIRGFDLGSSSVSWDSHRVTLTGLGKFAAEHCANILNLPVRRSSYEWRLERYFRRGYDLVLPDLSPTFKGRNLEYLVIDRVGSNSCCSCHIMARAILACDPRGPAPEVGTDSKDDEAECRSGGGRDSYENGIIDYTSPDLVNANNARALDRALRTGGARFVTSWLCACEEYGPMMRFSDVQPRLDKEIWLKGVADSCGYYTSLVPLRKLRSLVGAETASKIVAELLTKGPDEVFSLSIAELDTLCHERYEALRGLLAPIPLEFREVTDATSLGGDAVISVAEWYGKSNIGSRRTRRQTTAASSTDED